MRLLLFFFCMLVLIITACTPDTLEIDTATPITGVTPIFTLPDATGNASFPVPQQTATSLIEPQASVSCPQTPPSRLIIQDRGRVTNTNDETLNLRNGPGTSFDILMALDPLDQFIVVNGPTCADGFAWFRVRHFDTIGWIAEGDIEEYYVEPYLTG